MFTLIILPYLKRLWLPIMIGLIVTSGWLYVRHLQTARNDAIDDLNHYKVQQTVLANQQIAENSIKLAGAQTKVNLADNLATSQLTQLRLDRNVETNNLKALYENKLANLKRDMVHGLQSSPATSASQTTDTASDTQANPQNEPISDSTIIRLQTQYDTLEKACTIETIDFNDLRMWADSACEIVECK